MSASLDPRALEARTQAIGRELFAAARRHHAHLSVLNRWTSQVLDWCAGDPAVKANMLRLIDVLPSLSTPRDIARHVRDYFPPHFRLPSALRMGVALARPGIVTQGALAGIIRQSVQQVARQFIAESAEGGAAAVLAAMAARHAMCSFDILGEQVMSESEADRYAAACRALLAQLAAGRAALPPSAHPVCGPQLNLSVKPSALAPRYDAIAPEASCDAALARLTPILDDARSCGALVNLDMEQYDVRDLTLALARTWLERQSGQAAHRLGIVVQAYLHDAEAMVEELLQWLQTHGKHVTVRLVKGAYWDHEIALAAQRHWPAPVWQEKAATDLAFERLTLRLLEAHPAITTAVASHNVRSIAHAMAAAECLGRRAEELEFQLLYGMGDALHAAITERGYPVRIYTPIGELIPGMAYLVRRLLENTANESFLRQEFGGERTAEQLLAAPVLRDAVPAGPPAHAREEWRPEPLADFARRETRERLSDALERARGMVGQHYPLLLGANWVDTGRRLTVTNPAHPAQVLGTIARAGVGEVERAVREAQAAQRAWGETPVAARAACLRRMAEAVQRERWLLTAWTVAEVGKPWREADADVVEAIEYLEYYSVRAEALARSVTLPHPPGEQNMYRYLPRGVAAVIAPWNFPAAIFTGMTAAALVCGNTVIAKPAGQSPILAALLVRLFVDAGLPPGVLQLLPGSGEEVGAALVRHPGVETLLFTGSKAVGLSIIRACGEVAPGQRLVKRAIVEMGGKNAIIVDADADLDAAVQGIVRSAFSYAGQKCSAASRLIAHEAIADRLVARLIEATDRLVLGDPADPATEIGPLIEHAAQQRLLAAFQHAMQTAKVAYRYPVARLPKEGHYVGPMIVTNVRPDDRLAREELFGPLLCVFRARTFDGALALANDSEYALTGGVYSRSPSNVTAAIERFDVGNLYINRPITGAFVGRQPFGGHRLSGLGTKAGGPDYLLQMVVPKTVCINTARHGMPLEPEGGESSE